MEFRVRGRRGLFVGLSDRSHTNVFRRANPQLQNEQVRHSHQLTAEGAKDLPGDLIKDLTTLIGRHRPIKRQCFAPLYCSTIFRRDFDAPIAYRNAYVAAYGSVCKKCIL
jgi:hypothetical protein